MVALLDPKMPLAEDLAIREPDPLSRVVVRRLTTEAAVHHVPETAVRRQVVRHKLPPGGLAVARRLPRVREARQRIHELRAKDEDPHLRPARVRPLDVAERPLAKTRSQNLELVLLGEGH